jgi:hypothetical protein
VRAISLGDLVKDSNLNTLVELSDVQFTEAAVGRDIILKNQIM